MIPIFPVIELFDRLAIARVKWRRTASNEAELTFYSEQIQTYDLTKIMDLLHDLEVVHEQIWDLEKELKNGYEQSLALEEIGRRAIKIRDYNRRRISLKNAIAERLGDHVLELKRDHLSA